LEHDTRLPPEALSGLLKNYAATVPQPPKPIYELD